MYVTMLEGRLRGWQQAAVGRESKFFPWVCASNHIWRLRPVVMKQQRRITCLTMVHISRCVNDVYILIMNKRFIRRLTTKKKSISKAMEVVMVSCN
nr:hypothetical protein [Tanacetum cinerariifolium]